jgi:transglutaminase-like putative cysteine protease
VVYDDFTLRAWRYGETVGVARERGKELLADTADAVAPDGRTPYTVTVSPTLSRSIVYTPEMPLNVTTDATVQLVSGDDGYLAQLERSTSSEPYSVTALIRAGEKDGGATINKLRVAGQDYPAGMLEEYGSAAVPEGTFTTPEAQALLEEFARSDANPYDLSAAIVRALQDPSRFQYSVDVRGHRCDLSIVDCFAKFHDGYCEYYATTMAMILRSLDIPARIVEGYLPGRKIGPGNRWQVLNSDSHAWVQVFFPGYGWIDFDPTGGSRASLAPLPTGAVQGSPGSTP